MKNGYGLASYLSKKETIWRPSDGQSGKQFSLLGTLAWNHGPALQALARPCARRRNPSHTGGVGGFNTFLPLALVPSKELDKPSLAYPKGRGR